MVGRLGMNRTGAFQAALVDLDGTLVDTLDDFKLALDAMLSELGLPSVERHFVARTVGKGSEHLVRRSLEQATRGTTHSLHALFDRAIELYQQHYRRVNGLAARVYDGVVPGLQRLRSHGLVLGCITNKPTEFAIQLLERTGLASHFALVNGGDRFEHKKPHPMPLLESCRMLGVAPARTLMLGDSSNDALAARAAGCPVVLVSYGYNHGEPVSAVDADGVVDRLDEVRLDAA
jgi:phosphoglycolate phosphatase